MVARSGDGYQMPLLAETVKPLHARLQPSAPPQCCGMAEEALSPVLGDPRKKEKLSGDL